MIPLEAFIIAASIIGGCIGFAGAAMLTASRQRGLYNRGWNAGREFEATRQLQETLDQIRKRTLP